MLKNMLMVSFVVLLGWQGSGNICSAAESGDIRIGGLPLYSPTLKSRAISEENKSGAKGQGGKALNGRKGAPALWNFKKGSTYTFAEIEGPGVIRHIWITVQPGSPEKMRNLILRFYWDDQETPSVEAPLTDFFGVSHGRRVPFESEFVTMPEAKGFNCYFPMPFRKNARLVIHNEGDEDITPAFFYQVDYTLGDTVTKDTPCFHAQFRRTLHTTMYEDYVILDGVKGKGRYLGANIGIIDRYHGKNVWWGEGEVKMYLDGDKEYPTICGTGAEDYACTAWGMGQFADRYAGAPLVKDQYTSFYRFHVPDPVYFSEDIKVTIQQIGNDRSPKRAGPDGHLGEFIAQGFYRKDHVGSGQFERVDDMCSTAYWYQTLPTQPFPPFPDKALRSTDLSIPPEKN